MFFKRIYQNLLMENERWFLFLPVLFALGIGIYFSLFSEPAFLSLIIPTLILIPAVILSYKRTPLFLLCLAILIVFFGIIDAKRETYHMLKKTEPLKIEQITYLKGKIKQTDKNPNGKTRFLLENASDFEHHLKGFYRLTANDNITHQVGDCVEMAAVITPPSHPVTPTGYQFDRHAFFDGISAIGYTLTPLYQIPCENTDSSQSVLQEINQFRHKRSNQIADILPKNEAAVASAVLLGNKTLISPSLYEDYRLAGLAHFLAISGLHMGFLTAFFFIAIRFILLLIPSFALRFSAQKTAAFFAVIFGFIYLLCSGISIPATRAFIMTSFIFIGILANREAITMRMLAFAALILLILEPHVLLLPSFQMSFAAVCALVAVYEASHTKIIFEHLSWLKKIILYFTGIMLTSFIATLATLPYAIYHFYTFAPYAVLSNMVASPLIAFVIMPLICLNLIFLPFGINTYLLKALGFSLSCLNHWASYISNLPASDFHISPMPTFALAVITFGALWLCLWQKKWRYIAIPFILLPFIFCFLNKKPDIFYLKNTVAIHNKPQNELLIFGRKKSNFLTRQWSQNFQTFKTYKTLHHIKEPNFECQNETCLFQNKFTFDLSGHYRINGQTLTPQTDIGGIIFFKNDKAHIQTIRGRIGFRPWNS